jgi:hypothetical protein
MKPPIAVQVSMAGTTPDRPFQVSTVFPTVKRSFTKLAVKMSVPTLPSRVAAAISTSRAS